MSDFDVKMAYKKLLKGHLKKIEEVNSTSKELYKSSN